MYVTYFRSNAIFNIYFNNKIYKIANITLPPFDFQIHVFFWCFGWVYFSVARSWLSIYNNPFFKIVKTLNFSLKLQKQFTHVEHYTFVITLNQLHSKQHQTKPNSKRLKGLKQRELSPKEEHFHWKIIHSFPLDLLITSK